MSAQHCTLALLLAACAIPAAGRAQSLIELDDAAQKVCRTSYEGQFTLHEGGPLSATVRGEASIDRRVRASSFEGRGSAEIHYTPPAGCSVVGDAVVNIPYTVEVDSIVTDHVKVGDYDYNEPSSRKQLSVTLQCGAQQRTHEMYYLPTNVDLPLRDDADGTWENLNGCDAGGCAWTLKGTTRIGLCAAGERDYPAIELDEDGLEITATAEPESAPVVPAMPGMGDVCAMLRSSADSLASIDPEGAEEMRREIAETCN